MAAPSAAAEQFACELCCCTALSATGAAGFQDAKAAAETNGGDSQDTKLEDEVEFDGESYILEWRTLDEA